MLLITQSDVVSIAFMSREQISNDTIRPVKIDIAQEYFIRARLGDDMFQEMLEGKHAQFVTSYIKPPLAHYVRYLITQELSIKITNEGVLVFDLAETIVGSNEQRNLTLTIQDTTTSEGSINDSTVIVETQTRKDIFDSEHTNSADRHGTIETVLSESGHNTEKSANDITDSLNKNDSLSRNHNDVVAKSGTHTTVDGVNLDKTDKRKNTRPASASEIRVLALRALSDANILLAKAVRYVERNSEQFESYRPSRYSDHIFF